MTLWLERSEESEGRRDSSHFDVEEVILIWHKLEFADT